jgi:hypothetical protein
MAVERVKHAPLQPSHGDLVDRGLGQRAEPLCQRFEIVGLSSTRRAMLEVTEQARASLGTEAPVSRRFDLPGSRTPGHRHGLPP